MANEKRPILPLPQGGLLGTLAGLDVDFLSALGNILQLVGVFVSILANVSSARQSEDALEQAEDRITGLRKDLADLEMQVEQARRGVARRS